MTRYLITETCEYLVNAICREDAEATFLIHGPGPCEKQVEQIGVVDRKVEEADTP